MHNCKVQSHPAAHVQPAEHEEQGKRMSLGLFPSALLEVQEQVMGKEYAWELRCYQRESSLPFSRSIFGLFTIPVYINCVRAVPAVGTGAQISGIKSEKIAQLKLEKTGDKLQIGSIGRTWRDMQGLVAGSVQLGGLEALNMAMIALDSSDFSLRLGNIDLFGFDGILGWNILHQLDSKLDDAAKRFIVLKSRFRIPYLSILKRGFLCFLVKRAGQEIPLFSFDSDSRVSWIGEQAVQEHALTVIYEGSTVGFGVHELEEMDLKIIKQWMLYLDKAEITLKDTMTGRVRLFDDPASDRVFGNEIFRKRRIHILNSANMILLTQSFSFWGVESQGTAGV